MGTPPSRQKQPHHKQQYRVSRYGESARQLMELIYPFMGRRRQVAITKALARLEDAPVV